MDIMELGAIGELLGGIAVVGSLVYVGLQVRQGNAIEQNENYRSVISEFNGMLRMDLEEASAFRRAINHFEELPKDEQMVFHTYMSRIVLLGQQTHAVSRRSEADGEASLTFDRGLVAVLRQPGAGRWWARMSSAGLLDSSYLDHIQAAIDASASEPRVDNIFPWFGSDEPAHQEKLTMDLSQLANLGEFIGGVAVVVTLIYLAMQVRASQTLARADSEGQLTALWSNHTLQLAIRPGLARIIELGLETPEELDEEEARRFRYWIMQYYQMNEGIWRKYRQGLLAEDAWVGLERVIAGMFSSPLVVKFWDDPITAYFSDDFRAYMRQLRASAPKEWSIAAHLGESGPSTP